MQNPMHMKNVYVVGIGMRVSGRMICIRNYAHVVLAIFLKMEKLGHTLDIRVFYV
tara:strand:- start:212 stop:376 length:165 start_codon:yes stop_codon:yes gene_type:complete